jgi:hypothetical protein
LPDLIRSKDERRVRSRHDLIDPRLWQRCVYWYVRAAGFHRAKKCDQHFGLAMPEHGNRFVIVAETPCQVRREAIRAPAQFTVRQSSVAAKVCDCFGRRCGPVIDSLDQIH